MHVRAVSVPACLGWEWRLTLRLPEEQTNDSLEMEATLSEGVVGAVFFSGFASFFLGAVSGVPSRSAEAAFASSDWLRSSLVRGSGESRARFGDVELTSEAAVTISKGLVDEGKCVSSGTGRPVSASRARTA